MKYNEVTNTYRPRLFREVCLHTHIRLLIKNSRMTHRIVEQWYTLSCYETVQRNWHSILS